MDKMKWIIFAVIVVAVFGLVIVFNKGNDQTFTGDAAKIINDPPIADHVFGSTEQKVVLIEYGDYQCPGCGAMYSPIKELTEKYEDKLTFIFRHMPLTNIHPNALAAATAAEAAGMQGKYWQMHDLLYQNQQSWSDVPVAQRSEVFAGYASQLGLNADRFKQDLTSKDISDKISRDRASGNQKFGVDSTPTFVLNGTVLSGKDATDISVITQKVEEALKQAYPDATSEQPATEQTGQ